MTCYLTVSGLQEYKYLAKLTGRTEFFEAVSLVKEETSCLLKQRFYNRRKMSWMDYSRYRILIPRCGVNGFQAKTANRQ